jgi:hypothetical protein
MKQRKQSIAGYLLSVGRGLTRAGRLAGMIQVCRPNWSTDAAWYAAQILGECGVEAYRGRGSLTDYLAYLDAELTGFAHDHFAEQIVSIASEQQLRRWAERWQQCRHMTRAGAPERPSIAA